ncbi:hypothetical protein IL45_10475 [Nonlabens ulvanivorans]|uniref:DUF4064 domain-containing protein n=1 Tax=Nonlabens ulvanivorans TaxID=906888 RepID=A0A084JUD0_NONUL|nr:hypothetical protein IL45_10475 [Nonlabens ulvanivorans]PRX15403.1 hypothetical protein LY02_00620 [Nonlabens ulvanivorans]|tara:strand:- start:174 stop:494 length:321 start_codon:yes stop_codon:yes gene_type:complete
MDWLVEKRGYLVLLGLLSVSIVFIGLIDIAIYGVVKTKSIITDSIRLPVMIIQVGSTIIGFTISLYILSKKKSAKNGNVIAGLILCSPLFLFYLVMLILLLIGNLN